MTQTTSLFTHQKTDIERQARKPVLDIFDNQLNWKSMLDEDYFEDFSFSLPRSGNDCDGIMALCGMFYDKKLILRAPAGSGKSTVFKYLYLKANKEQKGNFFYTHARSFHATVDNLSEYDKAVKAVLETGEKVEGLFLIDGFEEAFPGNFADAQELLRKIADSPNHVWISCRPDFYEQMDGVIRQKFDATADIKPWTMDNFTSLLKKYSAHPRYAEVVEKVQGVANRIAENGNESILLRPLYATMLLFIARETADAPSYSIDFNEEFDEYRLLDSYVDLWFERELRGRGKEYDSTLDIEAEKNDHIERLTSLAIDIHKGNKCTTDDPVIRHFLDIPGLKYIRGFYHREFLNYFTVEGMRRAALATAGDITKGVVFWFAQTFGRDTRTLFRQSMKHTSSTEIETIYANLFSTYRDTYDECKKEKMLACLEEFHDLKKLRDKAREAKRNTALLKLRVELLYYILRLPIQDLEEFLDFAKDHSKGQPMLEANLAFGLANLRLDPFTLEFARKLTPGSEEDKALRAWNICHYGDAPGDGFEYVDDKKHAWNRFRKKEIAYIAYDDDKRMRHRIVDIPLLNCFYASRDYADCTTYRDYYKIKNCRIDFRDYSEEEREFVKAQHSQLLNNYEDHLLDAWKRQIPEFDRGNTAATLVNRDNGLVVQKVRMLEAVNENLHEFWNANKNTLMEKRNLDRTVPDSDGVVKDIEEAFGRCKVVILSANRIEGIAITRLLKDKEINDGPLLSCFEGSTEFQFAKVDGVPILHILPGNTSSFSPDGSFNALMKALRHFRDDNRPRFVFSVGVAFGQEPGRQSLGDVLISDRLVCYDAFNKLSDGKLKLNRDDVVAVGGNIFTVCKPISEDDPDGPSRYQIKGQPVGTFKWFKGPLLTGGTVLSDADEKILLNKAALDQGVEVVGGEMEGSGVYFACHSVTPDIPFLVVKGICDWGVNKNGWKFAVDESGYTSTEIKDCVQALACRNAFAVARFIISRLHLD